ncbi:uncharacterized protein LOC123700513 [Colias croceus]|uniref:uncharacterized protein LOC123700513 n=1 Tax=Colias crocea TaxID=72248 RepID=UPI001E27C3BA|nr:uncharacterized protein LOC123700513 [Colias croceus]
MWKCVGLLLFLGQWILVSSEPVTTDEEISRYVRKAGDCCPCPTSRHSDTDLSASENVNTMTCPCNSRNDDSDTASSIFSPVFSATKSFARQIEKNGELKPLLEPEVDLASSVLETLRQATEEEYKEALARDAARSAIQSLDPDALMDDVVAIVSPADARESMDMDTVPEASNNQESRCVYPSSGDYGNINILGRSSLSSLSNSLSGPLDLNYAPSNLYNNLNIPNTLELPGRTLQAFPFSPSGNRGRFLPFNRLNPFTINTRQPALNIRQLLNARRPLDLDNLMNLRDVELIPPRKVSIARKPTTMHPEEIAYKMKNPIFEPAIDASNNVLSKIQNIENIDDTGDCSPERSKLNQNNNIHTKILNNIPSPQESNIVQSNFDKQQTYDSQKHIVPEHNNYLVPQTECLDKNPSLGGNSLREHDPLTGESRNSINMLTSPNESNMENNVKPETNYLSQQNYVREVSSASEDGTGTQRSNGISSIKYDVLKTLEDFRQANTMMHENLRSSLDNVLNVDKKGSAIDDKHFPNSIMDKHVHLKEDRSSASFKDNLSMEDLQHMSDKILLKNNDVESTQKSNEISHDMKQDVRTGMNINEHYRTPANVEESNIDLQRDSTNLECVIHDDTNSSPQRLYKDSNEMNVAASEPINTSYRSNQYSYNIPNRKNNFRNPMVEDPLEDINLDIFQYQPTLKEKDGVKQLPLPKFNMKSYKTQLPIPNSLDLKPVKLQKSFRKGSNILGATLTMKPHATQRSFGLKKNKMRSPETEPNGLGIPDIDEIRSFLENNVPNILNLPLLGVGSDNNCEYPSGMRSDITNNNLRSFREETITNVQESLGKTFKEAKGGNSRYSPLLRDTVLNPTDIIETIDEAHENANNKLRNFQADLNDRLKKLHQSLMSRSRTPSSVFQQRERTAYLEPNRINKKYNPKTSLSINSRDNTNKSTLRSVLDKNDKSRLSSSKQNPSLSSPSSRASNGISSSRPITTNKGTDNLRFGQKVDSKRPLPLHERLKLARESKGIISFTTTKRPPTVESLPKIKPLSSRNPIELPKKDTRPNQSRWVLPESNSSARKQTSREPKTSPSEITYTKTLPKTSCDENNVQTLGESQGRSSGSTTGTSPRRSNKKSALPNIAENAFLSKVKEAVSPKHLTRPLSRNNNYDIPSNDDVIPSPSEVQRLNIEPSNVNGISFDCKMVCSKN